MTGNRVSKFLRRWAVARELGMNFYGTSRFRMPRNMNLGGKNLLIDVPEDDQDVALDVVDVILQDDYCLRELREPPKTIIDIGANIGLFSLWARHLFENAVIHAYEPVALTFASLEHNASQLEGISLFNEGVGGASGRSRVVDTSSSRLNRLEIDPDGETTIVSLEQAIMRIGGSVDLLKLDCEGFEWDIFSQPAPFRKVARISMEYHLTDGRSINDLTVAAGQIGFKIESINENQGFGMAFLRRDGVA